MSWHCMLPSEVVVGTGGRGLLFRPGIDPVSTSDPATVPMPRDYACRIVADRTAVHLAVLAASVFFNVS